MFSFITTNETKELRALLNALDASQAVIEFDMQGNILRANENFLAATGYRADEIEGRHHRMFVDQKDSESPEYREFWARLNKGEYQQAEYKRHGNGGREIWIQAS